MAPEPCRCTAVKHLLDAAAAQRDGEDATPADVVQYALDASAAESLVDIARNLGRIADELHDANRLRR